MPTALGTYRRLQSVFHRPPKPEIHVYSTHRPWDVDTDFQRVNGAIREHTLVDPLRCWELWTLVEQVRHLEGALLEVGVWRGGTGALIAYKAQKLGIQAPVYLADTFEGVVKTGSQDPDYADGEHSDTSEEIVQGLLASLALTNAKLLRGMFPEDTGASIAHERLRLVHCDVDVYQSANDVFDWAWPRLSVGGVIVYDDYGFPRCQGIRTHVEERAGRDDLVFLHNPNGHAVFVKTR